MAQVNPRHVDAVMELINRSPYFELLGIRLTALSEGACTVEAVLERKHLNAFGGAHGGAYASLLDCAAYWALYCSLDEDDGFTTVDLNARVGSSSAGAPCAYVKRSCATPKAGSWRTRRRRCSWGRTCSR